MRFLNCFSFASVVAMVLLSGGAATAADFVYSELSNGYRNCSYDANGNSPLGIFRVTIDFKAAEGYVGKTALLTRALLVNTYTSNGEIAPDVHDWGLLSHMSGQGSASFIAKGNIIVIVGSTGSWTTAAPFTGVATIYIFKSLLAGWPAIGVRAGNVSGVKIGGVDSAEQIFGEAKGLAYIGADSTGNCTVISNPENPPPPVTPIITMTAPDWDLGELPRGEETALTLPATKDQLCFSYEGGRGVENQKYLINATNINGLSANGRYLLKSLVDSSQTVPYTLTLANSKDSVLLPNTQNRLFSVDAVGRTCFTPTFRAQPDKAVKAGAYSDILTFTVVAKT